MRTILLPLCFSTLCVGCAETVTRFQPAAIDPTLLAPVPIPELQGETLADMAELIVDYDEALDRANGQISAIAETVAAQDSAND